MKKRNRALASATVLSLVLTSTVTATNVQAAAEVTRVPGANRETTAMEVAKQVFGTAETVVLVNGYGYADAVSATPLAKALNAPILLTNKVDAPTAELKATLATLGAKNIVIVGGTGAVTPAMEAALKANYTVGRIGGASRYETNAEVAKAVLAKTGAKAGVLVSAEGYADALSVASIAAAKGMPVLFGNKNEVPAAVKTVAAGLEVVAVGGEAVLPASVLSAVNATRVAKGATRFETNLAVLDHFKADLKLDNIYVAAGGATATGFADALVASAAAAKVGAPVVLTGAGANATAQENATDYITDNMTKTTKVTVIGGTASVSEAIVNDIKEAAGTIASVELDKAEITDTKTVRVTLKTAEEVTKDSFKMTGNTVSEVKKVDDKTYDLVLGTDLDLKSGTLTVNGKEVKYDFTDLTVQKVNATTSKVDLAQDADDLELEFTVNGGRKVTVDDLENEGYTVKFVTSEDVLLDDGDDADDATAGDAVKNNTTGDLNKEGLKELGVDETFDYQVVVEDVNGDEIARSEAKEVTVVDNFESAKQIDDITIESADGVEITSNKLAVDEDAQITKIEYTNSKGVDETLKEADGDFDSYDVEFKSSNPSVAFISKEGKITAVAKGTTTITIEVRGLKKTVTITVVDEDRVPKKATVETTSVKIGTESKKELKVTVFDQFGDPIKGVQFDAIKDIENSDDDVIATATAEDTDEDGKTTLKIDATSETGSGKLYLKTTFEDPDDEDKNKTALLATISVEVTGLTKVDTRKLEKVDTSDDYELDLSDDDDKEDGLELAYNQYNSKGAFLARETDGDYTVESSDEDVIAVDFDRATGIIKVTPVKETGTATVKILENGILRATQKITVVNEDDQMITAAKFETAKITDVQTVDIDKDLLKPENITVKNKKGVTRITEDDDKSIIYLDLNNNAKYDADKDVKLGELEISNSSVYDDDDKVVEVEIVGGKIAVVGGGKFQAGTTGTIVVKIIDTEDTDKDGKTTDTLASGTVTIDIEK